MLLLTLREGDVACAAASTSYKKGLAARAHGSLRLCECNSTQEPEEAYDRITRLCRKLFKVRRDGPSFLASSSPPFSLPALCPFAAQPRLTHTYTTNINCPLPCPSLTGAYRPGDLC